VVYNSVGVGAFSASAPFNVFPSPTDGPVSIDLTSFSGEVTFEVSDLSGQKVDTRYLQGGNILKLQFTLPAGIYVVSADNGISKARKKIVIEK